MDAEALVLNVIGHMVADTIKITSSITSKKHPSSKINLQRKLGDSKNFLVLTAGNITHTM